MKCTKCGGRAAVEIRRHNAAFCRTHFGEYFENQVRRAIKEFNMIRPGERVLVCVSGGKDSLVLWDVLLRLGYQADGLYIDLGIGEGYSATSGDKVRAFAAAREAVLHVLPVSEAYGAAIPELAARTRRVSCSACGLAKRYSFNRLARERGYPVVATGHNLDDEAAVLLGNVLGWQTGYLARQSPAMPAEDGFVRKVKPLYRVGERETAAYAVLTGIDYVVDECPYAKGARSIELKEVLNRLERSSPGTKHNLLFGFLANQERLFQQGTEDMGLQPCSRCGQPTSGDVCSFCRLLERAGLNGAPAGDEPVPGGSVSGAAARPER